MQAYIYHLYFSLSENVKVVLAVTSEYQNQFFLFNSFRETERQVYSFSLIIFHHGKFF
jgi:hypothetical protein